jgi:uncharacterized membrane protein (DUF4010 family)
MSSSYQNLIVHFSDLAIALALGLLIGSERGWQYRSQKNGEGIAGIRTFSLLALQGGIIATACRGLPALHAWIICSVVFVPTALLVASTYRESVRTRNDAGMTTELAALMTYWLGALPAFGLALPAAATAVVVALVLHIKDTLHHWLQVLHESELVGTLQFLLASIVLLPLLPNVGFGPWKAFNPYQLWWMVVLISGLSLVGYFAIRIVGPRKGVLATSVAGGLVSSTAVTLNLSRLHTSVRHTGVIAAGILLSCAIMFARILVVTAVINPHLLYLLLWPMLAGFLSLIIAAIISYRDRRDGHTSEPPPIRNPFELVPALQFALLLAAVMIGAEALQAWFGNVGLYLLSVLTGLADVDAIVLSLASKGGPASADTVVITAIALAAATNTLMKSLYCWFIAGPVLGKVIMRASLVAITTLLVCSWIVVKLVGS